jgi:hypothetical protein
MNMHPQARGGTVVRRLLSRLLRTAMYAATRGAGYTAGAAAMSAVMWWLGHQLG